MLAAVYQGPGLLEVYDIDIRKPGPDEVLVRVAACGLCGTDLHIFHGDKGAADCRPGTVLGHEFSGIIVEVGSDVSSLRAGDLVAVDPNSPCGACPACLAGKAHFCADMTGYGTTTHGGFAEYCTVRARQAYLLSEKIPLEQGALAEPVSCCLHGIDLCRIQPGATVLVMGAGTIGLLMIQLALKAGAAHVVAIEPIAEKRQVAKACGAILALDPTGLDLAAELKRRQVPPIDVAIECAGLGSTAQEAIRLAGNGATVMLFGLTPPDCEIPIKPFDIFRRELHITASFINPYTFSRALLLMEGGGVRAETVIGNRVPLAEIRDVFMDPQLRVAGKVLVVP